MLSYNDPKFHWKIPLGKGFFFFFQIFAKIEMTGTKNHLFGRHFETSISFFFFFFFFFLNMVVFSVWIYSVEYITKFRWESGFLKGVSWSPLLTGGEYLDDHLSVDV